MNIHLPAILGFTRYQGFDPSPFFNWKTGKPFAMVQKFGPPRNSGQHLGGISP